MMALPQGIRENLTGQRFGRLTVIAPSDRSDRWHHARSLVRCDCGNEILVLDYEMRRGRSRSCGCLRQERAAIIVLGRRRPERGGDGRFVPMPGGLE